MRGKRTRLAAFWMLLATVFCLMGTTASAAEAESVDQETELTEVAGSEEATEGGAELCAEEHGALSPDMDTHIHTYGEPVFTWEDDSAAVATFTCTEGDDTQQVACAVTWETREATYTTTGQSVYTAVAEFGGKTYQSTRTVTIPQKYMDIPEITVLENVGTGVKVRWSAVAGAEQYRVFRKAGGGDWGVVGDTTDTSWTDTKTVNGMDYTYSVRCIARDGVTFTSDFDDAGKRITFVTIAAPAVSAVTNTATGIQITWGKVAGAARYRVYRKTDTTSWAAVGNTADTSYTDATAASGMTYAYTVQCISSDGTASTSDYDTAGKRITYVAAPVISSLENVTAGIQVTWNKVAGAVNYRVYRKTNGGSWTMVGDTTAANLTDSNVVSGSTYSYTVRCINSAGTACLSGYDAAGKTIRFIGAPVISAVTNAGTGVQITWGKVVGAERYRVYRKTSTASWAAVGNTANTSYTDTSVVSGTTYIYTVRCTNSAGTACTSGYDAAGKSAAYVAAPGISSLTNAASGVRITWGKVAGAVQYRVFRKSGTGSWKAIGDTTSTSYVDTTAAKGATYAYTIRCINSTGTAYLSGYDATGKAIQFIGVPIISAVTNTGTGVQITWGKAAGAERYRVYRKTSTTSWAAVGDTSSTSYVDTSAVSGMTYTYTVRCVNSAGTACVSGYDAAGKSIAYVAAPGISSLTNAASGVRITWGKVAGAVQYRVFRKSGTSSWRAIGDTAGISYIDTTATKGTTYTYTIRCVNSTGAAYTSGYNAAGKAIQFIGAPVISNVTNTAMGVQITWGKAAGAERYRVYRKTSTTSWAAVGDTSSTSYVDTSAISGMIYTYTVRCVNSAGTACVSGYDAVGKSIAYVAAPGITSVTNVASGVRVTWDKVTGAVKYRVFRKTSTGSWKTVGETAGSSYTDTGVASGGTYIYTVRCINSAGTAYVSGYDEAGKRAAYVAAPEISSVTNVTSGVRVTWDKVTGAVKYRVFRKNGASGWKAVGDTEDTSYVDSTTVKGTTYIYTVRCINSAGTAYTSGYDSVGRSIKA